MLGVGGASEGVPPEGVGVVALAPRPDPRRMSAGEIRGQREARPKSLILREPVELIRMLAGLISKWMTPFEWMW